jgi:hypothetical protein
VTKEGKCKMAGFCLGADMFVKTKSLNERFWEKVSIRGIGDCWPWTARVNCYGYGTIKVDGKSVLAHRLLWDITNPDDLVSEEEAIYHACNSPRCCNPAHLLKDIRYKGKSLEDRFWERVDVRGADDCWLWIGCFSHHGYGKLGEGKRGGRTILAHRLSWDLAHPDNIVERDEVICHSCDNPPCVNPSHLWKGTQADNNRDMAMKGRAHGRGLPGSLSGMSKLVEEDIPEIFSLRKQGLIMREIAVKFGVCSGTIYDVLHGLTWRSVTNMERP